MASTARSKSKAKIEPSDAPVAVQEDNQEELEDTADNRSHYGRGRPATVYDAVAGRVKAHHHRAVEQLENGVYLTKHSTRDVPCAPDEVLFRRIEAPQRYAEHDIYFSHERDLPPDRQGVLPESDLLKAIHSYTSQFYGAMKRRRRRNEPPQQQQQQQNHNEDTYERTMDETALLAFGILLEEAGREVIGRHGDLVFVEAGEASASAAAAAAAVNMLGGDDEGIRRTVGIRPQVGPRVTARKRRRTTVNPVPLSEGPT